MDYISELSTIILFNFQQNTILFMQNLNNNRRNKQPDAETSSA